MATYRDLFFYKFANPRGNIKKGTKAIEVWNSIEEFLRLVLEPKPKALKINKNKNEKGHTKTVQVCDGVIVSKCLLYVGNRFPLHKSVKCVIKIKHI